MPKLAKMTDRWLKALTTLKPQEEFWDASPPAALLPALPLAPVFRAQADRRHPAAQCSDRPRSRRSNRGRRDRPPSVRSGVRGLQLYLPPLGLSGRQRRPPRDPVNSLLSFGYVLVGNEL
jgi:hypothetical protein